MPRPWADGSSNPQIRDIRRFGDRYPHVIVNDLKTKCKHPVVELGEYKKKILPELSCVGLV